MFKFTTNRDRKMGAISTPRYLKPFFINFNKKWVVGIRPVEVELFAFLNLKDFWINLEYWLIEAKRLEMNQRRLSLKRDTL